MATPKTKNTKNPSSLFGYDDTNDTWVAVSVNPDGSIATDETLLLDTPEYFEDTSFVAGDSPANLDLNTALGRNATAVEIINDGPGNFTVSLSNDGVAFGDAVTVKAKEAKRYTDVSVDTVRITWVADSAYRVEGI